MEGILSSLTNAKNVRCKKMYRRQRKREREGLRQMGHELIVSCTNEAKFDGIFRKPVNFSLVLMSRKDS